MQNPDPTQRAVLGWPIRWIAGLLLVLLVATGGLPAYACETNGPGPAGPRDVLFDGHDDRGANAALRAATKELLGSKSSSDSEAEEEDPDSPACSARPTFALRRARVLDRAAEAHGDRAFEPVGRRSGRAPPRA